MFKKDLAFGQRYERIALQYYEYKEHRFMNGYFKAYDILFDNKFRVEVKADRNAYFTKHVAIEVEYKSKPSGLSSTEADEWIIFVTTPDQKHQAFRVKSKRLRKLVQGCRQLRGGDGRQSLFYILPIAKLKKYRVHKILKEEATKGSAN